jgi:hypothetical protein
MKFRPIGKKKDKQDLLRLKKIFKMAAMATHPDKKWQQRSTLGMGKRIIQNPDCALGVHPGVV